MAGQGPQGNIPYGLKQGALLERLCDERGLPKGFGHIGRLRGRHEGKGNVPLQKSRSDTEAFAADHVDIQQSAVDAVVQMPVGFKKGADDGDDLVPLILEDRLQIERNRRIVF